MAENAEIKSEIKREIKSALESFSGEGVELYLGRSVPCLDQVPEPLAFHRDFVSPNRPVVMRGAVSHWPALSKERFGVKVKVLTHSVAPAQMSFFSNLNSVDG